MIISAVLSLLSIIPLLDAANSDFTFGYLILGDVLGGLLEIGLVALAVLAIVGGLAAHAEGNYTLAFVGGLASVFSIGGAVGLAGLVMIRASRSDFKSTKSESGSGLGPQEPRDPTQSWQAGGEEASPKDSLQKSLFIGR